MQVNWTFQRDEIQLKKLPNGDTLTAPVIYLRGQGEKKCYIQANNHGGEIAGNGAIFSLLKKIKSYDIYGTITIVPHCNPVSVNTQIDDAQIGVYDAATGKNWNRLFHLPVATGSKSWQLDVAEFAGRHREKSWQEIKKNYRIGIAGALERLLESSSARGLDYHIRFALELQRLSYDADYVLDLHTGDLAPRYLYAPEYTLSSAPYFHIPHVLTMGNNFTGAFDEATFCTWMTLIEELHKAGRNDIELDVESYTVELGSLETIEDEAMDRDAERILNYLKLKKMISGDAVKPQETIYCCSTSEYMAYCAPASGLAVISHPPGARFARDQEIGYILTMKNFTTIDRPEQAQTPLKVIEDGILITRRKSPIVFEGQTLFKMMTNVRVLEC